MWIFPWDRLTGAVKKKMTVGSSKMAIFAQYVAISQIRCIVETKLLQDANRIPNASYQLVSRSMTMKI